jgi:hypothetical protein
MKQLAVKVIIKLNTSHACGFAIGHANNRAAN